jgi:hypothetical protein
MGYRCRSLTWVEYGGQIISYEDRVGCYKTYSAIISRQLSPDVQYKLYDSGLKVSPVSDCGLLIVLYANKA